MNKKYLFRTALWAFVAIISACSSDELVEQQTSGKQITMTASDFKYVDESRTSITVTPNSGKFTWAENDTVGIFPDKGRQVDFPMTNGSGTNTASFNGGGWALKPSSTYAAYYPFNKSFDILKESIPVSFENQLQVGKASTAHLGKFDYMAAVATTPQSGCVNFKFQHLCSLVELRINIPKKGDLTSVTLLSDEPLFTTKGTIDLTSENISIFANENNKSNKLLICTKDICTAVDNEIVSVYLMMAPINLIGKTVKVIIENNGMEYGGTLESKRLEAGNAYSLSVNITGKEPIGHRYHVLTAGTLSQLVGNGKYSIERLQLSGQINGTDLRFIREMAGSDLDGNTTIGVLSELDLENVYLVKGGDSYVNFNGGPEKIWRDNILPRYAFSNCRRLTSIVLPTSITEIDPGAFYNCSSLVSAHIYADLNKMNGLNMFCGCKALKEIIFPRYNSDYIDSFAFKDCISLTHFEIPNSVSIIGRSAFEGCTNLHSLKLTENITEIQSDAFHSCTSLKDIEVPESVTSIDNGTFKDCFNLTTVKLPEGLKTIDSYAFENCLNLSIINIPSTVTEIKGTSFGNCLLDYVYVDEPRVILSLNLLLYCQTNKLFLPNTLRLIDQNAFPLNLKELYCFAKNPPRVAYQEYFNNSCRIYVPKSAVEDYKKADFWNRYSSNIEAMPSNIEN